MGNERLQRIHFIAIGGAVMHNLALALAAEGARVSGSDDAIHDPARARLAEAGLLPPAEGWFPEKITPELDAVVVGMHARADNPELAAARRLNLPVYSFPEFILSRARHKQRIVIAGSHGKTTITALMMHVLKTAGRDFDYLVGANTPGFERSVRLTADAPVLLLEGDEYPTSPEDPRPKFLAYEPHTALITGVAWDHMNVYPTYESYVAAFGALLDGLPKGGMCVYNRGDKTLRELAAKRLDKELHFAFPYDEPPARKRDGRFEIKLEGRRLPMRLIGRHNAANAAGAWELCKLLAIDLDTFARALDTFEGAARRMERVHESERLVVIRDFAHAPSKVAATVDAAAEFYKEYALTAVLELHTYSSLNADCLPEYRGALKKAKNKIILVEEKALALKKMPAISDEQLRKAFAEKKLTVVRNRGALEAALRAACRGRDAVLLMSSGPLDGLDVPGLAGMLGG